MINDGKTGKQARSTCWKGWAYIEILDEMPVEVGMQEHRDTRAKT